MALKEGVGMRAKRLNGGHLILNCRDSGVTPLVTSSLAEQWTFWSFSCLKRELCVSHLI